MKDSENEMHRGTALSGKDSTDAAELRLNSPNIGLKTTREKKKSLCDSVLCKEKNKLRGEQPPDQL